MTGVVGVVVSIPESSSAVNESCVDSHASSDEECCMELSEKGLFEGLSPTSRPFEKNFLLWLNVLCLSNIGLKLLLDICRVGLGIGLGVKLLALGICLGKLEATPLVGDGDDAVDEGK